MRLSLALTLALLGGVAPVVAAEGFYFRANPLRQGSSGAPVSTTPAPTPEGNGQVTPLAAAAPAMTPASVMDSVSYPLVTNGGVAPYSYARTSGSFPPSLELGSDGVITGQVTGATGFYDSVIRVTDKVGTTKDIALRIEVRPQPPAVAAPVLPIATVGQAFSFPLATSNGTSVTWTKGAGGTATWLGVSGATASGTPTAAGPVTFSVTATDAFQRTASTGDLSVEVAAPLVAKTSSIPPATIGQVLGFPLVSEGGRGTKAWTLSGGSLPQGGIGLVNGTLSGTVTGPVSGVSFRVTDADGRTDATPALSMVANPAPVLSGSLSPAATRVTANGAVTVSGLSLSGGTAPVAYEVAQGAIPTGLNLNTSTGAVSGNVSGSGSWSFALRAKDANGIQTAASGVATVDAYAPVAVTASGALPAEITANVALTAINYTSTGGKPTVTYALTGSVPPGVTLSNASLGGTPNTAGTYSFSVVGTDSAAAPSSQTIPYSLKVLSPLVLTPAAPPPTFGTTNQALASTSVPATGGKAPYTYSTSGSLPTGVTYQNGVLSGTPTQAGSYTFTLLATDAMSPANSASSGPYKIDVAAPVVIGFSSLPDGTVNANYGPFVPTASGGLAPYTWALAGTVPPGLTWDAPGKRLYGVPTTAGTSANLVFTATDAAGRTASTAALSLKVIDPNSSFARPSSLAVTTPATWSSGYSLSNGLDALYDTNDATNVTVTPAARTAPLVRYTWPSQVSPNCFALKFDNTSTSSSQYVGVTTYSGADGTGTLQQSFQFITPKATTQTVTAQSLTKPFMSITVNGDDANVGIRVSQFRVGNVVSGACVSQ